MNSNRLPATYWARLQDDDEAATHLRRLGVNSATIARLRQFAERDNMGLRELVRYVLINCEPAE